MKTRQQMERSATYLCYGAELGHGLDPELVEKSLWCIANWKKWFVHYMKDKTNLQVLRETGKEELLGEDGAKKLADNIFRAYYDAEKRAFEEPTKGRWNEREPGEYEYGNYSAFHASRADEVKKDDFGWKLFSASRTPDTRKQKNFAYLMDKLLYCNNQKIRNRILVNARGLYRNGAITRDHWDRLQVAARAVKK